MTRPVRRIAAVLLAVSASSCSCNEERTHVRESIFEIRDVPEGLSDPRTGTLLSDTDPLVFGPVKVGLATRHSVALVNSGDLVLTVQAPTLEKGEAFGLVRVLAPCTGDSADPYKIEVDGCRLVTLQVKADAVGPVEDVLHLRSDDPDRPAVDLKVTAQGSNGSLQVCVSSAPGADTGLPLDRCSTVGERELTMDLGGFPVGSDPLRRRIEVSNVGPVDLVVSGVKVEGAEALDFGVEPRDFRLVLHPDDVALATLVYRPTTIGVLNASVRVTADDPASAPVVIHLAAQGDGPRLCIDPPLVDFGAVTLGSTSPPKTVSLRSCGTRPVTAGILKLEGFSDFQFAAPPATPAEINPGDAVEVQLHLAPTSLGARSARLKVPSTDANLYMQFATLIGKAVPASVCKLEASTHLLDFGTQVQMTTAFRTVTLHNAGSSDCAVSAETLDAGAPATRFFISRSPPVPFVLAPNALQVVEVGYQPVDAVPPDTGTLSFTANDPTLSGGRLDVALTADPVPTPECRIAMNPVPVNNRRQLNFGVVAIGDKKTLSMTLQNVGSADCVVQKPVKFALTDPAFSFGAQTPALPATLRPGDISIVEVVFQPAGEIDIPSFVQFLTIQTSENRPSECQMTGGGPGCKQVYLAGNGVILAIDTVPASLDFGEVTVGCNSIDRVVTVYNVGGASVTLTGFAIDPPTAPFTIVQQPANLPLTLNPGQSTTVSVRYKPTSAQPATANLIISHNFSGGTSTVPLKGTGTTESHQTDTFTQNTNPKTDVLWVIDNSGSMYDKQDYLGENAVTFIEQANITGNDYQVAVIATEWSGSAGYDPFPHESDSPLWRNAPIYPGEFFGNPQIIRRTDPNPAQELERNIQIGNCCSDHAESGLEAAKAALTNPLISDPTKPNSSFIREDAKLAIIVLSDEEDQGASQAVGYYVDLFQQLKGAANTQLFAFHAIVGDVPNGCNATVNGMQIRAAAGDRYLEAVTRTNGIFRSICTTDWGHIAEDIGLDAFTARLQYFLSRTPDTTTLVVSVNGNPKAAGVDYDYDAASNSIIFRAASSPPPGASIVADYEAACL